jgi:hypothetical protein
MCDWMPKIYILALLAFEALVIEVIELLLLP